MIETAPAQPRQAGGEAALDDDTGAAEPQERAIEEAGGEPARLAFGVHAVGVPRCRAGTADTRSGCERGRPEGRRGRQIRARGIDVRTRRRCGSIDLWPEHGTLLPWGQASRRGQVKINRTIQRMTTICIKNVRD